MLNQNGLSNQELVRPQRSNDNPGWNGSGVPSLRKLTIDRSRLGARRLFETNFSFTLNLVRATIADLWNFHFWQPLRERVECPCCSWTGPAFMATYNWRATSFQAQCPQCDSRSRHRGLIKLLSEVLRNKPGGPILFFAPELILMNQLVNLTPAANIVTTDHNSIDVDYPGEDIQKLSFTDSAYALLICNHVLEHVLDDQRALFECARVLKSKGIAIFTIPGDFQKTATVHFKQLDSNGHYRHYGMDLMRKMETVFSSVQAVDMSESSDPRWRVRQGDYAFVCTK
jgi:predicted SAM-dependent methyltransferase